MIGAPTAGTLTPSLADDVAARIGAEQLYFLADGIACDLMLPDGVDRDDILAVLDGEPLDVVVQEQDTRRKRVLLADMDSTMIREECIDELAAEAGVGAAVARITAAAMRGEIDFEQSQRQRVTLLEGLETAAIDRVLAQRIHPTSGGATLVATMKAHGAYCALVSGGYAAFTASVAAQLGFDEHRANVLEVAHGRLTGRVSEPILGADAKLAALHEIAAARGVDAGDVMAVGDGANDLAMIEAAGSGVALHAKPVVAATARHRIDHGDLTALLYMQGYRAHEFA